MISEQAVQIMEEYADDAAKMIATFREMGRERGELEGFESSWRALIEVARLLNSDARLRDALGEARGRKADADMQRAEVASDSGEAPIQCGECGERAEIMHYGKYLCIPCYEIANAAQFGPTDPQEQAAAMQDDPDLAPSDAQDDEAGEVEIS